MAPRAIGPHSSAGGHPCRRLSGPIATADLVRDLAAVARRLRMAEIAAGRSRWRCHSARCSTFCSRRPAVGAVRRRLHRLRVLACCAGLWLRRVRPRWMPAAAARAIEARASLEPQRRHHGGRAAATSRARARRRSARECSTSRPRLPERSTAPRSCRFASRRSRYACAGLRRGLVTGVSGRAARAAVMAIQEAVERARPRYRRRADGLGDHRSAGLHPRGCADGQQNPERIEALQGSRLRLTVRGGGAWRVRFGAEALVATESGGARSSTWRSRGAAIWRSNAQDRDASASRRLIPVTVIPDRAPTIRVEAPGKDLLLPDATPVVGLSASATDDFGLAVARAALYEGVGLGRAVRVQGRGAAARPSRVRAAARGRRGPISLSQARPRPRRRDDLPHRRARRAAG